MKVCSRFIAIALLGIFLTTASGISNAYFLVTETASAADSCCPSGSGPSDESPSPCSSPECKCTSCFGAIIIAPPMLPELTCGVTFPYHPPAPSPPSGFTASIEYPPESA